MTEALVAPYMQHRICVCWVGGVLDGGLHNISAYCKDGEHGAGPVNAAVIDHLEFVTKRLRGPWVIAADWNMTPGELLMTGFLERCRGVIYAPSEPTHLDQIYDYFVVTEKLAHAVHGCYRLNDSGISPHSPVRLFI